MSSLTWKRGPLVEYAIVVVGHVLCFAVGFLFGRIQSPIQIIFLKRSSVVQEMDFGGRLFPWQR